MANDAFQGLELVFKEDCEAQIEIPVHWDLSALAEVRRSCGLHQKRLGTPLGDPVADAWFRN